MSIDTNAIKELRRMTSAGLLDCKTALEKNDGNIQNAAKYLRETGVVKAVSKMNREAKEGSIFSYIHHNSKIGVLLELNCETDFVANNKIFKELGKNISMHIAASSPVYIDKDQVPLDNVEEEKEIQRKTLLEEGKPANIVDKILEGKIKKYLAEICLLEQPFVKEPQVTIQDIIKETISKIGENVHVSRFQRFSI